VIGYHCYYVTEKLHQTNVTRFFHFGPLPIKISGYASEVTWYQYSAHYTGVLVLGSKIIWYY